MREFISAFEKQLRNVTSRHVTSRHVYPYVRPQQLLVGSHC